MGKIGVIHYAIGSRQCGSALEDSAAGAAGGNDDGGVIGEAIGGAAKGAELVLEFDNRLLSEGDTGGGGGGRLSIDEDLSDRAGDFLESAGISIGREAGRTGGAADPKVATGQWGAGDGTDAHVLPGQAAWIAANAAAGNCEDHLGCVHTGHEGGTTAADAIDVVAGIARA